MSYEERKVQFVDGKCVGDCALCTLPHKPTDRLGVGACSQINALPKIFCMHDKLAEQAMFLQNMANHEHADHQQLDGGLAALAETAAEIKAAISALAILEGADPAAFANITEYLERLADSTTEISRQLIVDEVDTVRHQLATLLSSIGYPDPDDDINLWEGVEDLLSLANTQATEIATLNSQNVALSAKIDNLNNENVALAAKVDRLISATDMLELQNDDLSSKLNDITAMLSQLLEQDVITPKECPPTNDPQP